VLAAMAELQFRPNRAARMLTTARSRTIGVPASASSLYGPASSLDAAEDAARNMSLEFRLDVPDFVLSQNPESLRGV
jgi:DNA-binding LacI/PurR family transcriptional regulator